MTRYTLRALAAQWGGGRGVFLDAAYQVRRWRGEAVRCLR